MGADRDAKDEVTPMKLSIDLYASIAAGIAILLLVVWRFKARSSRISHRPVARGPGNMRFVCAGCSGQFTHTKRTVAAWEKGSRQVFCNACHKKWRNAQPRQAPPSQAEGAGTSGETSNARETVRRPAPAFRGLRDSRSGCLGIVVLMVVIPVALFAFVTHG